MAGSNVIPELTTNFMVYGEDNAFLGVANVELPEIAPMTTTVSGAGIAGEVEVPVLSHFGSMSVKLQWRQVTPEVARLAKPTSHELVLRAALQSRDATTLQTVTKSLRIALRSMPKSISLGTLEAGATTDTETELEVAYFKMEIDGKEMVEIDKFNFKASFEGDNTLDEVKQALGMS